MRIRAPRLRALQALAACLVVALCAVAFRGWLAPRDMSLWLGAWLSGLCM
ncbi:hypothetical protein QF205_02910 [Luteimonas composti]|uniref:Uncharacterized protein n=1 Tax=Luteimonas composti TaxID=398257 RepID=A0ABT6MN57_9GAMM|nr:hypothetical protein [Luteimonas composti]MDH7452030.1 hypothetical protein [Luteimonas composti]